MSRCFPFPAPGYEKKARLDDEVLLTKEKHKEKKQKKDKKGKNKNTDRNKEKRCGRKDRKEKHRDKNKSKDESKNWIQSEKRVEGNQECYSGEKKLVSNGQQSWEINGSKYVHELDRRIKAEDRASGSQELQNFAASDKKRVELPKQLEGKPEEHDWKVHKPRNHVKEKYETNPVCPNFSNMHQRRIEDRASGSQELRNLTANDKKSVELPKQLEGTPEEHDRKINKLRNHVKEKYETNSVCPNFSNMHQRRIEDRASGSQELLNFTANDKKSVELPKQLEGTPEEHDRKINKLRNHVKEKYETNSVCPNFSNMHQRRIEDRASGSRELRNFTANDKKSVELLKQLEGTPEEHDLKINKLRNHVKEKYETNSVCPNFSNMHQRKIEQINTSFKKHIEVKNDNKEKDMTEDNGQEKKRKSNAKAGVREKEKKKKVEKENKSHIEQPKHIRNGKESINAWNAKISQFPQMSNNSASSGIHKCKNFEMNEHSLGNGFLPHKVPMGTSSHLSTENGKCEPLQAAIQGTSKRPRATNNGEVDVKGANDIKGHERPRVTLTKTLSSTAQVTRRNGEPLAKQSDSKSDNGNGEPFVKQSDPKSNIGNGELFTKPPHPDSKYLSQILSVPEIGELCECDQEWLFNSNNLQAKKPKMSSLTEGSPQVWEQTLQINFSGVFALPYVIPY